MCGLRCEGGFCGVKCGDFGYETIVARKESREVAAQRFDRLFQSLVEVRRFLQRNLALNAARGVQQFLLLLAALGDQGVILRDFSCTILM